MNYKRKGLTAILHVQFVLQAGIHHRQVHTVINAALTVESHQVQKRAVELQESALMAAPRDGTVTGVPLSVVLTVPTGCVTRPTVTVLERVPQVCMATCVSSRVQKTVTGTHVFEIQEFVLVDVWIYTKDHSVTRHFLFAQVNV